MAEVKRYNVCANDEKSVAIMEKALKHYGIEQQTMILAEECGELIQASTKVIRASEIEKPICIHHLTEEIADVFVMINQLALFYKVDPEEINQWVNYKIARLNKRLEDEECQTKNS